MLAQTSYTAPESVAVGGGGGSGVGSGGAPARYAFTSRGWVALSPWIEIVYAYSLSQLNLGSNPLSKLEVASMLNILSQANRMYQYYSSEMASTYKLKVYLGTLQSIANWWLYDNTFTSNSWPKNYQQGPQKGEFFINEFFN